jgi:hypothetical protein
MLKMHLHQKNNEEIFYQVLAETSYCDKPLKEASENIKNWRVKLEKMRLPEEMRQTLFYILNSRQENIVVLSGYLYPEDKTSA